LGRGSEEVSIDVAFEGRNLVSHCCPMGGLSVLSLETVSPL
jgi:hypothetical protein